MSQRRFTVGTTPVLLANQKANRASFTVTMTPSSVESANTGNVFIGKGFTPSTASDSPNKGDILTQGSSLSDNPQFDGDPSLFLGQWWAVADTANQVLVVDETVKGV